MPTTGTPTTETLSSPPPLRPQRRAATAASWTHCLQRCDTHPMAAHYRLTHREQRNDATPCHTIAAASGAASGSGQRRIGCGKYRPRVCLLLNEQSQPVRSAGAHTAQTPVTSSSAGTARPCAQCRNATDPIRWLQGSKRGGPIPAPPLIPRPQRPRT
jgi:hypothetical protein